MLHWIWFAFDSLVFSIFIFQYQHRSNTFFAYRRQRSIVNITRRRWPTHFRCWDAQRHSPHGQTLPPCPANRRCKISTGKFFITVTVQRSQYDMRRRYKSHRNFRYGCFVFTICLILFTRYELNGSRKNGDRSTVARGSYLTDWFAHIFRYLRASERERENTLTYSHIDPVFVSSSDDDDGVGGQRKMLYYFASYVYFHVGAQQTNGESPLWTYLIGVCISNRFFVFIFDWMIRDVKWLWRLFDETHLISCDRETARAAVVGACVWVRAHGDEMNGESMIHDLH